MIVDTRPFSQRTGKEEQEGKTKKNVIILKCRDKGAGKWVTRSPASRSLIVNGHASDKTTSKRNYSVIEWRGEKGAV